MNQLVETKPLTVDAAGLSLWDRVRRVCGDFWLNYLFWHADHVPWVVNATRGFYLFFVWHCGRGMRRRVMTNAARLLGEDAPLAQRKRVARRMIANFYLFVYDVGRALRLPRRRLLQRIDDVQGREHYRAVRDQKRGAILVTAHMGSFEVGVAALRELEEKIHVVFQRDRKPRFERLRSALHARLGVIEAPIDDGWTIWLRLRNALLNDEVVLMQGDRVMPGQKGVPVPFLGGTTLVPTGPIKLALASGAPVVPIFSIRLDDGRVRLVIERPIEVRPHDGDEPTHPALLELTRIIERYVKQYPDQWLALHYVCREDAQAAVARGEKV